VSGNYTKYMFTGETTNNNVGIKAGVGLSDRTDIKIRYEKLMVPDLNEDIEFRANYVSVIPKFSLIPGKLSLFAPISMYDFTSQEGSVKRRIQIIQFCRSPDTNIYFTFQYG